MARLRAVLHFAQYSIVKLSGCRYLLLASRNSFSSPLRNLTLSSSSSSCVSGRFIVSMAQKPSSEQQFVSAHSGFGSLKAGSRPFLSYGAGRGDKSSRALSRPSRFEMSVVRTFLYSMAMTAYPFDDSDVGACCFAADQPVWAGCAAASSNRRSTELPGRLGSLSHSTLWKQKNLPT